MAEPTAGISGARAQVERPPPPKPRVKRQGVPTNRPAQRSSAYRLKSIIQRAVMPGIFIDRFNYSPIAKGEIRLLTILKGNQDADMNCTISKWKLSDVKERYEALSYCWGTEKPDCGIYIRDLDRPPPSATNKRISLADFVLTLVAPKPQKFHVRRNLYAAMTYLRKPFEDVTIWIDAICINQQRDGEEEKQQQLAQMAEIYNSAKNVCIWLGEADVRSDSAIPLIREMMNFHEFDMLTQKLSKSRWVDLISLMKAPWFSRRWIIQEIVMARNASVHCGSEVVHWDDFSDAVSLLNEKADSLRDRLGDNFMSAGLYANVRDESRKDKDGRKDNPGDFFEGFGDVEGLSASILVKTIRDICRKSDDGEVVEKRLDLETLVSTLLSFQASIAQDDIYSLLSIARDAPKEPETDLLGITANYKRSTRDLYIAFVKRCIDTSGCLDIICRHWAPPVRDVLDQEVELPSWISKLSKSPFGLPGQGQGRQNGENFVGCTHGDKRKRYDASQGTSPVLPVQLISENALSESPMNSPTIEKTNIFKAPGQDHELSNGTSWPPLGTLKVLGLKTIVDAPESPTAHALPSVNGEKPKGLESIREESESSPDNSLLSPMVQEPTDSTTRPEEQVSNASSRPTPNQSKPRVMHPTREPSIVMDKERSHRLSGILEVSGFKLATITDCSDVIRGGIIPGTWMERLGWKKGNPENRVPDRLWRTLVADRSPDGGNPPGWYQRACLHCLEDAKITDQNGNLTVPSHTWHKTAEMTMTFLKRVESVVWNRRFIQATAVAGFDTHPLFGLAPGDPADIQKGDLICILFGCTVPVILRPVPDSMEYELMGEAYIHGKMDGEAVANKELVESLIEYFQLR